MAIQHKNPYTPGAAHAPPYLAGRNDERKIFQKLLKQEIILENMILTGIRGIGKTVLLREFYKSDAIEAGWLWTENDITEGVSVGEQKLLTRLFTDLGIITGGWVVDRHEIPKIGFNAQSETQEIYANSGFWQYLADNTPGLNSDKLRTVLEMAWELMRVHAPDKRGIVFAYDEAQNFADNSARGEYPLSLLLDVFSHLQRKNIPFMLTLTGLPPLHSKLVDARTFAERMFRVVMLQNLNRAAAFDSIMKPLSTDAQDIRGYFERNKDILYNITRGYPYFIQYWCGKLYDYYRTSSRNENIVDYIQNLLDEDFFAGRWAQLSDRQRDLLLAAAHADQNNTGEFSVQDIVNCSDILSKPFKSSHANQMLTALNEKGMVFKTRHGKYKFAVPMLDGYIRRRHAPDS